LDETPQLKFLLHFDGVIWNLLASEQILLIEVRDPVLKQVKFSAYSIAEESFLWKDRMLEEQWWVTASALAADAVIFTVYMDTNNPDKKGIVVYSMRDLVLMWWNNDFSLSSTGIDYVQGFTSKLGLREVALDLRSGQTRDISAGEKAPDPKFLEKPVQYTTGSAHFETVRSFLADRLNFQAVSALEYLESGGRILISCYTNEGEGLANYLFVLSAEGNVLLKEKLDAGVKGIGMDTFFILNGCVIFVRKRVELVSYKLL
jgi:hypothetical protein